MQVGLNLYSLHSLISTPEGLDSTVKEVKNAGYSYLQYSGGPFDPQLIKAVSDKYSLPVYLTHVPFDRIVNDTDNLMKDHDVFGCKNIGLGALPFDAYPNEKTAKGLIDKLEKSAQIMKKNGFSLFFHHHYYEFYKFDGKTHLMDYIITNAPDVNITVDTYWLQYGGVDVVDFIGKLNGRMGCVHLKDYGIVTTNGAQPMKTDFVPVGDGTLNFNKIIDACIKSGTKYFFVEEDNACDKADPISEITRSAKYLTELK